jgi:nucleotide-binding universal stress UspA family protein
MKVMKIVVPLAGSAAAEAALPEAVNRVKANAGSRLLLVRAVDPISVPPRAGSYVQARAISEAAEYLGKGRRGFEARVLTGSEERSGSPPRAWRSRKRFER